MEGNTMTRTHSYIVSSHDNIVARIPFSPTKSGIKYAYASVVENIDAAREKNLVNAKSGRISNAKIYDAIWAKAETGTTAVEINPREWLIETL